MTQNLNDEKSYSSKDIENRGIDAAATDFSEGSSELKHCLLNLWKLGIETCACCKGTVEKGHDNAAPLRCPYINIKITPENKEKLFELSKYLLEEKSAQRPNIIFKNYNARVVGGNNRIMLLERVFHTNKSAIEMFESIKRATDKMLSHEKVEASPLLQNFIPLIDKLADGTLPAFSPFYSLQIAIKKNSGSFRYETFSFPCIYKKYHISKSNYNLIDEFIQNETIPPAKKITPKEK